jgi:hypothetical protein
VKERRKPVRGGEAVDTVAGSLQGEHSSMEGVLIGEDRSR